MSLSMDDKLLGEKTHYYCSSSEDEDESPPPQDTSQAPPPAYSGTCVNTGPKGVIKDWQKFKQLETEQKESDEREKRELINKLSFTCRSHLNDDEKKAEDGADLLEELEDDFLMQYRKQRFAEMMKQFEALPKFGKVMSLSSKEFNSAVDSEKPQVTVVVHVYTEHSDACEAMNGCLTCLALEYPRVKFCKILASEARMSGRFIENGVPALLVYRNKELVGNFVRMSDEFGEDFFATDVESYLLEHGMLPSEEQMTAPDDQRVTSHPDSDSSDGFDVD